MTASPVLGDLGLAMDGLKCQLSLADDVCTLICELPQELVIAVESRREETMPRVPRDA